MSGHRPSTQLRTRRVRLETPHWRVASMRQFAHADGGKAEMPQAFAGGRPCRPRLRPCVCGWRSNSRSAAAFSAAVLDGSRAISVSLVRQAA